MTKRIIAGLLTAGILGGLAYYSGTLYSGKSRAEEQSRLKEPSALSFREEYQAYEEEQKPEAKQGREPEAAREEVSAEADAVRAETEKEYYYLIEESGCINIYLEDRETLYEETEITMDELPEELKREIRRGKSLAGKGELYDFLENYSS